MIAERIPNKPAQPLSETHYPLFLAHCTGVLSAYFDPILPALHLEDSKTPTVLELYVGSPEMMHNINWRGEDGGKVSPEDPEDIDAPLVRAEFGDQPAKNAWKESKEGKALARWISGVVRGIGGVEWVRSGGNRLIVTVAVPVDTVISKDDAESMRKRTGLKLVDLYLTPSPGVPFAQFVKSYEIIHPILNPLLKLLYPRLYLAESALEFHYTPFTGHPTKVNLALTHSPEDLCKWLGLDYGVWLAGLEVTVDVWDWLLSVDAGSQLAAVLRRIKCGEKKPKGGRPGRQADKAEERAWNEFVQWVKEGDFDWEDEPEKDKEVGKVKMLGNARMVPHGQINFSKPRELDEVAMGIIRAFGKEEELERLAVEVKSGAEAGCVLSYREAIPSSTRDE